MTKRKWNYLVYICVGGLLIAGVYQLFRGCWGISCPPTRNFTVLDLGIPTTFFPEKAIINDLHTPSELDVAKESAIMAIYWDNGQGLAVYNIWRFRSVHRASSFFDALSSRDPYPRHGNLLYESKLSREFHLGCGVSEFGGYRCELLARYEEFVLSFNATIAEKMTIEQFEEIVVFIDNQMGQYLNPLLPP